MQKKEYAKHDEFHQWNHVEKVIYIALRLAKFYSEVDLEILKLAIIFHDVSYESYETHVDDSLRVAENFLKQYGYSEVIQEKVLQVMVSHSSPHRRKLGEADLIEGKIIYDADKFHLAGNKKGFEKYYDKFYLDETRELLEEFYPELF